MKHMFCLCHCWGWPSNALVEHRRPQVKRIVRHRHLPAPIFRAAKLRRTMVDAERRRTSNRIAHSAPGSVKVKPARKKKIVEEQQ